MARTYTLGDLVIYRESLVLVKDVFDICKHPQLSKEYSLCDQVKRASVSVCANIAEGYGRKSKADFKRFLAISLGSANEVIALFDIIKIIFPKLNIEKVRSKYEILSKQIYMFRLKLIY
jgi:four helix bundle protein